MKLLVSQKDTLYELINASNYFTPNQFHIKEAKKERVTTTIFFRETDYYFRFCEDTPYIAFFLNYSPGYDRYLHVTSNLSFDAAMVEFCDWLENLKREINTPNLWKKFTSQINDLSLSSEFDNSKFTYSEYSDLEVKIKLLMNGISVIPLMLSQQNEIKNSLEHLLELAKESGKFDWKNLFIGTIISIIIQLGVTPDNASAIWSLIKSVFNNYFLIDASH